MKSLLGNDFFNADYILEIIYDSCLLNYESMLFTCRVSSDLYDYEISIYALSFRNHLYKLC
jgi:hypothetical protein